MVFATLEEMTTPLQYVPVPMSGQEGIVKYVRNKHMCTYYNVRHPLLGHRGSFYICSTAVCEPECVNGVCVGPQICSCEPGYHGYKCENGML